MQILQLILDASLVVQIVLAILIFLSIYSWAIIFNRFNYFAFLNRETKSFLAQYKNSMNIKDLYTHISGKNHKVSLNALFFNGINEYNKLNRLDQTSIVIVNVERVLSAAIDTEIDKAEKSLAILATFGSVSPYIGLLGTVWGIMHAFLGLSNATSSQATLATVAPGIAEALIATAIGLFVAIPAYIFYNKFSSETNRLNNKMNKFSDEFLNRLNSQLNLKMVDQ